MSRKYRNHSKYGGCRWDLYRALDLSIALGKPAKFNDSEFLQAIDRILAACKNAGKLSFTFAINKDSAKDYLNKGFDGVAYNMDASILIDAFKTLINDVRSYYLLFSGKIMLPTK